METRINIPDSIIAKMKRYRSLNWDAVIARELILKVSERDLVEEILRRSKLTKKVADDIDAQVKAGLLRRYHGA